MPKLTDEQASFLHDEPNVGIVAVLREDGTPHQTHLGREEYPRPEGEERLLVRIEPTRIETHNV